MFDFSPYCPSILLLPSLESQYSREVSSAWEPHPITTCSLFLFLSPWFVHVGRLIGMPVFHSPCSKLKQLSQQSYHRGITLNYTKLQMRILLSSDILKIVVAFVTQLYTCVSDKNNYFRGLLLSSVVYQKRCTVSCLQDHTLNVII